MSESWYLMTTPNQTSGFEDEYFNDYATDSFNELLNTFVGDDVTIYNSTLDVSSVVKGIVQSKDKKNEKQILLPLNSCSVGMYIKYKNLYWLITEFVNDNKMYQKAIVILCNYTLKFQSPNGTILSYPCIDSTNSSVGIDTGTIISTGNSIHTIKLPFDVNTKKLCVDRRLYISKNMDNPRSFAITKINDTEFNYGEKGLIEFTLEETANQDIADRPDLGICNYFEPTVTPPTPPVGNFAMSISTSGELLMGNPLARTYIPKLVDSTGTEQTFVAVWTFNYNGMPTSDFAITYDGNKCLVNVKEDYDNNVIDNTLVLTCATSDGLYSASYNAIITA